MLNDLEGAAMSYSKVLSLAPHHTDTRCVSRVSHSLPVLSASDVLYIPLQPFQGHPRVPKMLETISGCP